MNFHGEMLKGSCGCAYFRELKRNLCPYFPVVTKVLPLPRWRGSCNLSHRSRLAALLSSLAECTVVFMLLFIVHGWCFPKWKIGRPGGRPGIFDDRLHDLSVQCITLDRCS